jgi:hypothetical protein
MMNECMQDELPVELAFSRNPMSMLCRKFFFAFALFWGLLVQYLLLAELS